MIVESHDIFVNKKFTLKMKPSTRFGNRSIY